MVPNNYYPDVNKFHLSGPPKWFLQQLWNFDNSLVIVPSRQDYVYRLAQRRKLKLTEKFTNDMLFEQSDTKMLASYGLVPVTSIIATVNWGHPFIFEELRRRAPWRLGGAEKVINQIEANEAADEAAKKAKTDDHLDYLSKDAWKFYNKKIGLRGFYDQGSTNPHN